MKRLNIIVTETVNERLHAVQERTGAASVTEVFRRALAAYDLLTEETKNGAHIVIEKDGAKERLVLV